ncbi:preprotein translocase subunit SecY [Candidatus Liberibacter americanus]|uniref:Protein translocase subunit SecY n=1 Tax=Candidatus Liberibacter americanus str. Sao Paulo TaxID=1261131 RepID=U6B5I7_9HYPH|nr:preprotein translocase subunit SecY [Candidatus Liberibacter americanus]AHA28255.1 Preprotein translocase subunit SecY [Candidatus Liberibacter americanus str. Sao Paulo]EMS36231.1 preprotein translocase subunit SecY [Candidatus Liberibacter americanus PW_SP]
MASAVEQFVSNLSLSSFSKAKDLRNKILFTIFALVVCRIGTYVPLPGIDPVAYARSFQSKSSGIFGLFNMFSGGAVERMAVFALGIMPYISASIIVQLVVASIPALETLKKDGEQGRRIINQYTRYATVLIGALQAFGLAVGLINGQGIVFASDSFFVFSTVVTLLGGTMFLVWLGEQITSSGVGNGVSLIIFSGIVAGLPSSFINILELGRIGSISSLFIILVFAFVVLIIAFVVFFERAQRRLLIQYPKRQVGNRIFQEDVSYLPLKINTAGVVPSIFASSLLLLPTTIVGFIDVNSSPKWVSSLANSLNHGNPLYMLLYSIFIVFFSFFYTAIVFDPKDASDNLKKNGGFVPGIRPGDRTTEYIDNILTRITVVGSIYLVVVCIFPEALVSFSGVPISFSGTSVLIVVSVILDTIMQIQGYLIAHQYEGFVKKSKFRSRKKC